MAKHHGGSGHSLRHLEHAFPGEHAIVVRPVKDDARRSTVDAPRRGAKVRSRDRRKDDRKVSKLLTSTHKGKTAKTQQNSSTGRSMGNTAQQRPMGQNTPVKSKIHPSKQDARPIHQQAKKTGMTPHRQRVLSPHAPRAYHIMPVAKLGQHLRSSMGA